MGCAGLKSTETEFSGRFLTQNSTKRVVNMAIHMMNYIEELTLGDGTNLKIRIGVHYGRVIAGIIGHHKPQFSLIGDTINTTSRVCSTGEVGKITLSQDAYKEVRTRGLKFTMREIFAKGKGNLKTYILQRQIRDNHRQKIQPILGRSDIFRSFKVIANPNGILESSNLVKDPVDDQNAVNYQHIPPKKHDSAVSNSIVKGNIYNSL